MKTEETQPSDLTRAMLQYRECVRYLWNTYYLDTLLSDPDGTIDFLQASFFDLNDILFRKFVLFQIGKEDYRRQSDREPYPFVLVRPLRVGNVPVQISRDSGQSGYWDYPIEFISSEDMVLQFIGFFDWQQVLGPSDLRHFRVRIASSKTYPDTAGHDALLEVAHCEQVLYTAQE